MAPGDVIRVQDLPVPLRDDDGATVTPSPAGSIGAATPRGEVVSTPAAAGGTLREFKEAAERAFLVEKLREHGWNISKTAEALDTPRSNLYKKLEQYGIKQEIDG
jgi:two-component system nitrogen regulation response regulator NtrX